MVGNKKVILFTYGNFPYGGASANLLRLFAIGLKENNNGVEVILPTGHYYGNNIYEKKVKHGTVDGIDYRHLGFANHPKNFVGKIFDNLCGTFLPFFYLIKKSFKKQVDVIIIYHTTLISSLVITITSKIIKCKLIVILPEFYEKPKDKGVTFGLLNWYSFFISIRYVVKFADGFIVLSYYLEKYVKEILKSKREILIMPNLTDPDKFVSSNTKPFIENKITIGYTGTPTRKDGVEDLIRSFSLINKKYLNTHLLIIGDITNGKSLIPSLKEFAKELCVLDNITFSGLVSYNEVPRLLQSCQILALTRPNGVFAEAGFPTKLGEYFACRKPVVITKVGDIGRYFRNEEHVMLVEPENIESIVNGFERLILETELAARISNNSYVWMNEKLNYKNVARSIDEFLSRIVETKT